MDAQPEIDGKQVVLWLDQVTRGALSKVRDLFPESTGIFAVGGCVRDFFLDKRVPSDLDIAISGITLKDLERIHGLKLNYFGGGQAVINGTPIDIWPLETSAVLEGTFLPSTIQGLLRAFDFNLERAAINASTCELIDGGCLYAVQERIIEYSPIIPRGEMIQSVRLILLKRRTGFSLSPRARLLLVEASRLAQDDGEWQKVIDYLKAGGKYFHLADDLRKELLSLQ